MKIYFGGSINGGRDKLELYQKKIAELKKYGEVLTEKVGDANLKKQEGLSKEEVYNDDIINLGKCNVLISEVSNPSLGVGYEIAYAEKLGKPIICLYDNNSEKKLSFMIDGNKNIKVLKYNTFDDIINFLRISFNDIMKGE